MDDDDIATKERSSFAEAFDDDADDLKPQGDAKSKAQSLSASLKSLYASAWDEANDDSNAFVQPPKSYGAALARARKTKAPVFEWQGRRYGTWAEDDQGEINAPIDTTVPMFSLGGGMGATAPDSGRDDGQTA